ncbi:MAG: hypothetical protein AAFR70_12660, partial [Pseudomonadota bacterium]
MALLLAESLLRQDYSTGRAKKLTFRAKKLGAEIAFFKRKNSGLKGHRQDTNDDRSSAVAAAPPKRSFV